MSAEVAQRKKRGKGSNHVIHNSCLAAPCSYTYSVFKELQYIEDGTVLNGLTKDRKKERFQPNDFPMLLEETKRGKNIETKLEFEQTNYRNRKCRLVEHDNKL